MKPLHCLVVIGLGVAAVAQAQVPAELDTCLLRALSALPTYDAVTVVRRDGERLQGYLESVDLHAGVVVMRVGAHLSGERTKVPREQIAGVERRLGAGPVATIAGAVLGGLLGAAGGAAIAKSENNPGDLGSLNADIARDIGYTVVGAITGAVVGGLIGHLVGNSGKGRIQAVRCPGAAQ